MNSVNAQKEKLYRTYLKCVDESLNKFLKAGRAESAEERESKATSNLASKEWCVNEKNAYFNNLRDNFKTEYDNILRLESQNY